MTVMMTMVMTASPTAPSTETTAMYCFEKAVIADWSTRLAISSHRQQLFSSKFVCMIFVLPKIQHSFYRLEYMSQHAGPISAFRINISSIFHLQVVKLNYVKNSVSIGSIGRGSIKDQSINQSISTHLKSVVMNRSRGILRSYRSSQHVAYLQPTCSPYLQPTSVRVVVQLHVIVLVKIAHSMVRDW